MFKYQKGLTDLDIPVIMFLVLAIVIWLLVRVGTAHNELNEALTNSGIMCKPMKVNGKYYCAEGIIIKSNNNMEQHSAKEIGK